MKEACGRRGVRTTVAELLVVGVLLGWSAHGFGWPVRADGSEHENDRGLTVGLQPSGGVVVGGDLDQEDTGGDQAIVAFDPVTGGERWRWTLPEVGTLGGGLYYEYIQQLTVAADGDVIGVGRSTDSAVPALVEALVVKVDGTTGEQRWLREMNGDLDWALSYNAFATVAVDASGDVVVGGALQNSMPLLNLDFTVMKLAGSDGATLWRTTYPGILDTDAREAVQQVAIAPNGDVVAVGQLGKADPPGAMELIVVRLAGTTGAEVWSWRTPWDSNLNATKLLVDPAGDVLLLRQKPDVKSALTKFAGATGAVLWERPVFDAGLTTMARNVALDAAGNAYAIGAIDGALVAAEFAGGDGAVVWQRTLEPYAWPRMVNPLNVVVDGTNLVVGGDAFGQAGFWKLARADGSILWRTVFSSPRGRLAQVALGGMLIDAGGNVFAAGLRDAPWRYDSDMALWKLSPDGTIPLCGNGVLDPGEECDDGNRADGDGCDRNCAPSLCAGGVAMRDAKLVFSRPSTLMAGKVVLTANLGFTPGSPSSYDPVTSGVQILVEDVNGGMSPALDVTSRWAPVSGDPAGVCDPLRDAWSARGGRLRFVNRSGRADAPACSLDGTPPATMQLIDRRATAAGIGFKATFKRTPMPPIVGPYRVTVVLGTTVDAGLGGACATHTFATDACHWNTRHTTYTCQDPRS